MSNPPNEKVCEELFLMYTFMRVYRLKGQRMIMYAPTLHEENKVGYDAKVDVGCRELYLQFKRAKRDDKSHHRLYFDIDRAQLKNLKDNYPLYSAFYVVGSFENQSRLGEQQRKANIPHFLNQYLAIPAHFIPDNAKKVSFCHLCHQKGLKTYVHKSVAPYCVVGSTHYRPFQWFYGDELLQKFVDHRLGATIKFNKGGLAVRESSIDIHRIREKIITRRYSYEEIEEIYERENFSYEDISRQDISLWEAAKVSLIINFDIPNEAKSQPRLELYAPVQLRLC